MKKLLHVTLHVSLLLFLTVSCKEDDPAPTKTDLLTSKPWKLIYLKLLDIESQPKDCAKDDIYIFNKDKTSTQDEGPTKCNPNDPQVIAQNWSFNPDETLLTLTAGTGSASFTIDKQITELTSSSLKVKYSIFGISIEEHYDH
jgi:hypothetical protein